jgi:predicted N-formylglutamate amidohydrolase
LDDRCPDSLTASNRLLACDDPPPFVVTNPGGESPFVLLGDHAGRVIPKALGDLGLPPQAMDRHIAWDIGVAGLGQLLSEALDACFVRQTYSRLVIDCNRRPEAPDAIPPMSDGQVIPGNAGLLADDIAARRGEIYAPYQEAIAQILDGRAGRPTVLVSLHSFTPVMGGFLRPWRFGILHRNDSPFSSRLLALLQESLGAEAGDNQPYAMDGIDNTIPLHADARGLDYAEIEVRQDLLADVGGQAEAAARLITLLARALAS